MSMDLAQQTAFRLLWCQINRKIIATIEILFDLTEEIKRNQTKFGEDFSCVKFIPNILAEVYRNERSSRKKVSIELDRVSKYRV